MKTVDKQVAVTFGITAGGVLLLGLAALVTAAVQAGSLSAAFAQPEKEMSLAIVGMVCCCLAAAYGVIALIFGRIHGRYVRRVEELSRFGLRVKGKIAAVHTDWLVRLGRQRPVFASVECVLPDGQIAVLRSHRIWRKDAHIGMHVAVLIDPADEKAYAVVLQSPNT